MMDRLSQSSSPPSSSSSTSSSSPSSTSVVHSPSPSPSPSLSSSLLLSFFSLSLLSLLLLFPLSLSTLPFSDCQSIYSDNSLATCRTDGDTSSWTGNVNTVINVSSPNPNYVNQTQLIYNTTCVNITNSNNVTTLNCTTISYYYFNSSIPYTSPLIYTNETVSVSATDQFFSGIMTESFAGKTYYPGPYAQGDSVPTVVLSNNVPTGINKILFFPGLDTFSLLQVVNSTDTNWLDGSDSTRIRVEMLGVYSDTRLRWSNSPNSCIYRVPFWTLIVTVSNGYLTGMQWDDDCSVCNSDACVDSNCGVTEDACTANGGVTDCDLKIYVCWTGTDRDGVYLTSVNRRLSVFRKWSLNAAYNAATNFANSNLPAPPDTIPECPEAGQKLVNGQCTG